MSPLHRSAPRARHRRGLSAPRSIPPPIPDSSMAAMASLAPAALCAQAPGKGLQREGTNGRAEGVSGAHVVQLRLNSEFACKVAISLRGRAPQRRVVEFGSAVRGFSTPGGGDSGVVEGLPSSHDVPNLSVRSHAVEMKKGYGAFGGGGATLEKSKLDLSQSTARVKQEVWVGFCGS